MFRLGPWLRVTQVIVKILAVRHTTQPPRPTYDKNQTGNYRLEPGVETLTSGREHASRRQLKPRPPFAGFCHTHPLITPQYWSRIWCPSLGSSFGVRVSVSFSVI